MGQQPANNPRLETWAQTREGERQSEQKGRETRRKANEEKRNPGETGGGTRPHRTENRTASRPTTAPDRPGRTADQNRRPKPPGGILVNPPQFTWDAPRHHSPVKRELAMRHPFGRKGHHDSQ